MINVNGIENIIAKNEPWYLNVYDYSKKREFQTINQFISDYILYNIEPCNLHYMCSWFISKEIDLEKFDYKCYFYDFDPQVFKYNKLLTNNAYNVDVVFEPLQELEGTIINKYCNECYPLSQLYKGEFILVGDNEKKIYYSSHYNSIDDLINHYNLTTIYEQQTIHIDNKNFFFIHGNNL